MKAAIQRQDVVQQNLVYPSLRERERERERKRDLFYASTARVCAGFDPPIHSFPTKYEPPVHFLPSSSSMLSLSGLCT